MTRFRTMMVAMALAAAMAGPQAFAAVAAPEGVPRDGRAGGLLDGFKTAGIGLPVTRDDRHIVRGEEQGELRRGMAGSRQHGGQLSRRSATHPHDAGAAVVEVFLHRRF